MTTNDHPWVSALCRNVPSIRDEGSPAACGSGAPGVRGGRPFCVAVAERPGYRPAVDQDHPLLRHVLPDLIAELIALLEAEGERELAVCAWDLRFFGECGCNDDFCQSIRTADHPQGQPYGAGHRCVPLVPAKGMLNLDVVHGRIMYVEILDRPPLLRRQAGRCQPVCPQVPVMRQRREPGSMFSVVLRDRLTVSDVVSELQAALDEALSPSWARRARAGRDLASFADVPAAAEALVGLLLDAANTAVTRQTAETLAQVGTVGVIRLIALEVAGADDSHADWMQTGAHDALAGRESAPDLAAVCEQLARDPDAAVRRGAADILAWTQDPAR